MRAPRVGAATARYRGAVSARSRSSSGEGVSGQVLARQMEVAQRRADVAVAHQALDGVDVHPGLEQVRGERVPQPVDAAVLADAGAILGSVEDASAPS